ncbi:hypothetical protein BMI91_19475 [Thioclava sediminum]|uniref:Uncharacterized protein n=1 Tax=Thioclava sediminum TaxID=1915319 RepID=A0ABX3MT01_9RHOB|nr:hypothetical protein [Thioclava sediminum]OOY22464.1 hypothetical protein BMI91_19475 [Thioclava sediminum]
MTSDNEQELDRLTRAFSQPGPAEEEFFARRRAAGLGVGIGADGQLVYASESARKLKRAERMSDDD